MKDYTTKKVRAEDCYLIRKEVLRPHQTVDQVHFKQDNHTLSFHIAAFDNLNLIGVISILYDHPNVFRLRGMAIAKSHQRQGIGKLLIKEAIDLIPPNNLLWCNARTHVQRFYQGFGFEEVGKVFALEHTGPHIKMQLKL